MAKTMKYKLGRIKSISPDAKTIEALVSTFTWDRMDERFAKGSWALQNFRDNPVVLWAHDSSEPPIAKAISIQEVDSGLLAIMQFDAGSERAMDIFRLYTEGFMSSFSVGFIPKKWVVEQIAPDQKGIVFTDAELLEFSAVPIPANPGARIGKEQAELVCKAFGDRAPLQMIEEEGKEAQWLVKDSEPEGPETPAAPESTPETSPPAEPIPEPTPETPAPISEPAPEKAPEPERDPVSGVLVPPAVELEKTLKYLIDLSKTAKLDKSKVELCQQAVKVLSEIVDSHTEGIPVSALQKLQEAVNGYAKALQELYPDNEALLRRVMNQVDKALGR